MTKTKERKKKEGKERQTEAGNKHGADGDLEKRKSVVYHSPEAPQLVATPV